jgi:hypothetical protein
VCNLSRLKVLSRRYWRHLTAAFSSILYNTIHFKSLLRAILCSLFFWLSKHNLLAFFLLFDHLFSHTVQFRKVYHTLTISKLRYSPLPFFLAPCWIVDNIFELVLTHKYINDSSVLLYLFFLVTNSVKQLFLLILMLILNILEFNQVSSIFLFDLLKPFPHLIYFLI